MAHPAREEIIDLATSDIAELSPTDLRSWISHVIVHSMMGTSAGPRIDRIRLQSLVEDHCEELLAGSRFDFSPVLAALLRIPGVTEEDLYVGVVSLIGQLASMNIKMEEPKFSLSPLEKAGLLDAAYTDTQEAREEYHAVRLRQAVSELRRKRLGELLVDEGLIDEQQLVEGLEAQAELGGRLGSNLVRMGYIDEEQLAAFLGKQLGLPTITKLERVHPDAVRRIPKTVAERYEVVPISVTEREIGVAMADPSNLEAIDAVTFTTGLRVKPAVAPEVLIQYALARFYGTRTRVRVRRLDLHRAKVGSSDLVPGPWSMSLDLLTADLGEHDQPVEALPVPTDQVGTVIEPADDVGRLALTLADARCRREVFDRLGGFLVEHFATGILFEVDGTEARARFTCGVPQAPEGNGAIRVDVHHHPVLSDVFLRRGLFLGGEPEGQTWLCDVLHIPKESLLNVVPVLEHDRVVALLVGNARRKPCDDPVGEDQAIAHVASTAMSMVALRERLVAAARR